MYRINLVSVQEHQIEPVVADTGTTHNFFTKHNEHIHTHIPLLNIIPIPTGIEVLLPNKQNIQSTHTANLDISFFF